MPRVQLSFTSDGSADETLLLSNSLGASTEMWDDLAGPLSESYRVLRYDHRGHGASPVPPGPYELADIADDVVGILDALGIQRASFCGVSLGGMVGLWLAAHAPDRIDRLIICCSSAHMPPPSAWAERAAAVRDAGTVAVVADSVVERWLTPAYAQAHPEVRDRLRAMLADTPAEGYASCCEAIGAMDQRGTMAAIDAPTLVISAAQDAATPPDSHGRIIAEGIPGARFVVIDDAAHLAPVQQPARILTLVLDHLKPA